MAPLKEPFLVIGSRGMLGSDLVKLLTESGADTLSMDIDEVDITQLESVRENLLACKPGTVFQRGRAHRCGRL